MKRREGEDARLLGAIAELLRGAVAPPSRAELDQGLGVLHARLERRKVRSRVAVRISLAAALLCSVGLGVLYVSDDRASEPPVAIRTVEGGKIIDGGYVAESGGSGVRVTFNEGSLFRLEPGSRGRLRSVSPEGPRFSIEQGTAHFEIERQPGHRWLVEAGPFLVTVTGTEFSISWDASRERFELTLRRGQVLVSGPVLKQELALEAGQTMVVDLPKAQTLITRAEQQRALEGDAEPASKSPSAGSSAVPSAEPAPAVESLTESEATEIPSASPARTPAPRGSASAGSRWREALASGRWDQILSEAERDGVEATLEAASRDDLLALADAARYRRRAELSRAALLAVRRRFPSAVEAVFLLGRVEELRPGAAAAAIAWYDEYLMRAPRGTYAAEALGRKMILTNETAGREQARPLAEEYLRRFPGGSYARAARALMQVP